MIINSDDCKISIVVPVYNVEKYLSRCIESLLAQTYKNFEIILVDDGSTDNSGELCNQYEREHKVIRVIHKENGGLSDARNCGMNDARGSYITFVDSDDYIHPLYLELLVKGIQKGADFSVCDFTEVYDGKGIKSVASDGVDISIINAKDGLIEILYQKFHDVAAWGILLPLSLARRYPFPKGRLFEDLYTTYQYYFDVQMVAFVRVPLYYYFQRADSIMSIRNDNFINDLIDASNTVVENCQGYGRNIELAAKGKRFSNYCRLLIQTSNLNSHYPKQYHHIVEIVKKERITVLFDQHARLKNRLAAFSLLGGVRCLQLAFKLK
ncbi:glycosyltransferase family 2 protein [Veillonella atypica]|jgi:glycosyl transferase cpsJ|uniref:glycosyltransferase family 2 protein n=1 Tax=Veillonella atypica TaxID=39777 RepID=UPI002E765834|nr:glycosyltransferase [Veillonella atypica]